MILLKILNKTENGYSERHCGFIAAFLIYKSNTIVKILSRNGIPSIYNLSGKRREGGFLVIIEKRKRRGWVLECSALFYM